MPDQDALFDALHRFARTMSRRYEVTDALYEICDQVTDVVGATGAGVALLDDTGALRFVTATNEAVVAAEHVQERTQSGPCRSAVDGDQPVAVRDVREHAEQWPSYCDAVAEHGLVAVLALPLVLDGARIGSLDIYDDARDWTESEIAAAGLIAEMATAYVLNSSEIARSRRTAEQLQAALDTRVVIEQAKGKLAGRHDISVDDAFHAIRHHARSNQLTVRAVAEAIVDGEVDVIEQSA